MKITTTVFILKLYILCMAPTAYSQAGTTVSTQGISVPGTADFSLAITDYKVGITLSLSDSRYSGYTYSSTNELKKEFLKRMAENGIDTSKISENRIGYLSYGKSGDGTYLEYITSDFEKLQKFIGTQMPGSYVGAIQYKKKLLGTNYDAIFKEALQNAKSNATLLAKQIDKKVGKVLSVSAEQFFQEEIWSYYGDNELFRVFVTYELIDQ